MSVDDRLEYIRAVNCLMKLPSRAPKDEFPGALNRFDDFVAYHMGNSPKLHDNFNLLPAHRYFIYAYEQALRNECGYKGYQPVSSLSLSSSSCFFSFLLFFPFLPLLILLSLFSFLRQNNCRDQKPCSASRTITGHH